MDADASEDLCAIKIFVSRQIQSVSFALIFLIEFIHLEPPDASLRFSISPTSAKESHFAEMARQNSQETDHVVSSSRMPESVNQYSNHVALVGDCGAGIAPVHITTAHAFFRGCGVVVGSLIQDAGILSLQNATDSP